MIIGKVINIPSFIDVFLKKQVCPTCGQILKRIKKSKIVPACETDYNPTVISRPIYFKDQEVEVCWYEFYCDVCNDTYCLEFNKNGHGIKLHKTGDG